MSKFLKFSNRIVNTGFIRSVDFDKNAQMYTLNLGTMNIEGSFLLSSGGFKSDESRVYVTKVEHPESYAIIEKWIGTLECASTKQHPVLATAAPEVSEEKK